MDPVEGEALPSPSPRPGRRLCLLHRRRPHFAHVPATPAVWLGVGEPRLSRPTRTWWVTKKGSKHKKATVHKWGEKLAKRRAKFLECSVMSLNAFTPMCTARILESAFGIVRINA